jgi:hypothetical protein
MTDRTRLALGFLAVFVLGGVCGGGVVRVVDSRHQVTVFDVASERGKHGMFVWSLEQKLALRPEQRAEVEKVLIQHDPELRALNQQIEPSVKTIKQQIRAEIRAVLDPTQQGEFDSIMLRYDEARAPR